MMLQGFHTELAQYILQSRTEMNKEIYKFKPINVISREVDYSIDETMQKEILPALVEEVKVVLNSSLR